ncbi:cytochrome P450 4c3 [Culex quinquefasciatus]|uniref:Cytochrome P450 4c3 n=2 Tax=Culex pipiens complex TaxID=518105 RepID=B0WQN9_CULQU|nr:cytochrome P450 4c3 [Culex quinquefasciatus]|eukprot:XP_001851023.1 cytochrome P450 4c3 [Culex quinquefasciatus]
MLALLVSALLAVSITWLVTTIVRNMLLVKKLQRLLPKFATIPSVPVLGNSLEFRKDPTPPGIFRTFFGFHRRFGENVITQSLFNFPSLQVTSGPVVEQVINTKTIQKSIIYEFMKPWLGEGLLTALGKKWAQRRKVITPAFHFKILEEFLDIFNQRSEDFVGKLRDRVGKGDFNIYEDVTLCTLDIISESAMGVKINAQDNPDSSYVKAVKEMSDIIFRRLFSMMREYKVFFYMQKAAKRQKAAVAVLHDFTDSVIVTRKTQLESEQARKATQQKLEETDIYGKRKLTLLELLLNVSVDGHPLSNSAIRAEVDTFMFAGHDTTTSCISFAAYHIARNPSVQQKLHEEMTQVLGSDFKNTQLTYSMLQELKYLDMTIKEVLRIHPSVPVIGRKSAHDMVIDGQKIPPGIDIAVLIYAMHNNPGVFPEPDRFDPERFNEENSTKRHPYAYIPFSAGARNCIGQKYALLEIKATLVKLLGHYRLLACDPENTVRIKTDMTLRPVNGTFVKIVER